MQLGSVCGSDGGGGEPLPHDVFVPAAQREWGVIPAPLVFVMGHHIPWIPASTLPPARAPRPPGLRDTQPCSNTGCKSWPASRSEQRDAFRIGRWKKPHGDQGSRGIPTSDHRGQGSVCPQSTWEGSQASRAAEAGHAHTDTQPGPWQTQA